MKAELWASIEDIAKHLGVANDSAFRQIITRGLVAHRVGKSWEFELSKTDEWSHAEHSSEGNKKESIP